MKGSVALLKELTEADGVPGFEEEVRAIFVRRLEGQGEISRDRLGSMVCTKRGTADSPRVMLDCHLDEVGFIVQHVLPNGFLKFLNLGGWWNHVLPAQRVRVFAGGKKIPGIIGSTPPHFLSEDKRKKVLDLSDMFIDVGASSREEAESWGIRVGTWAAPVSPFVRLENEKLLMGKAFDNRAGCAVCIEATERVKDHPNTIFATGSVQEEVGLRGATASARVVRPDVALVLEGTPGDDTPGFRRDESQAVLGEGVQLRAFDTKMITNPRLLEFAIDVAREEGIKHQLAVRSGGSTDGGAIHLSNAGVPTLVLGVPARYIHTHASVIHIDDYHACLNLVLALLKRLDEARVASF